MKAVRELPRDLRAIAVLGGHVFRDVCRRRFFTGIAALALFCVLGSVFLVKVDFGGDPRRFVLDFCFGILALFGAALAVALTALTVREPFERGTVDLLIARPVGRGAVCSGLFLGAVMALTVFVVVIGCVAGVLAMRHAPATGTAAFEIEWAGYFLALWIAWLRLFVIAAMVFFIATLIDSTPIALLVGFLLILIGETHGIAADVWGHGANGTATALLLSVLHLVPDLRHLQATVFLHGTDGTLSEYLAISMYAFLFAAAYSALAVFIVHRRAH